MGSGTYFAVDAAFWTDPEVVDNFTPEDKYFYLYLLTCIHGNVAGCFQISTKQMADELGYSKETVEHLIDRFVTVHKMIDYSRENKEILIHKWCRHHWTKSDKYLSAVEKKISAIKTDKFREYLEATFDLFSNSNGKDTVWIPYQYGMDTSFLSFNINNSFNREIERDRGGMGEEEETTESVQEEVQEVVDEWNDAGFKSVERISLSSRRGEMTKKRIQDYGVDKVIEAIHRARSSDFLHGKNERGWMATYDWFIRPENFQKVLEGNYDNRKKNRTFMDMYWEEVNGKGGSSEIVDVT